MGDILEEGEMHSEHYLGEQQKVPDSYWKRAPSNEDPLQKMRVRRKVKVLGPCRHFWSAEAAPALALYPLSSYRACTGLAGQGGLASGVGGGRQDQPGSLCL